MISKIEIDIAKLYNISKSISVTLQKLCSSNSLKLHFEGNNIICYEMILSNALKMELLNIKKTKYARLLMLYDFQNMAIAKTRLMFIEGEVTCFSFGKYYSASLLIKEISCAENSLIKCDEANKEYIYY